MVEFYLTRILYSVIRIHLSYVRNLLDSVDDGVSAQQYLATVREREQRT